VDAYRVDLDELLAFIDRLKSFDTRADDIASAVDTLMAQLHGNWLGESAEAHRARHAEWKAESEAMRQAVMELHSTATRVHDNYSKAIAANTAMWR
jgi:WXG100 family type VII secretion target